MKRSDSVSQRDFRSVIAHLKEQSKEVEKNLLAGEILLAHTIFIEMTNLCFSLDHDAINHEEMKMYRSIIGHSSFLIACDQFERYKVSQEIDCLVGAHDYFTVATKNGYFRAYYWLYLCSQMLYRLDWQVKEKKIDYADRIYNELLNLAQKCKDDNLIELDEAAKIELYAELMEKAAQPKCKEHAKIFADYAFDIALSIKLNPVSAKSILDNQSTTSIEANAASNNSRNKKNKKRNKKRKNRKKTSQSSSKNIQSISEKEKSAENQQPIPFQNPQTTHSIVDGIDQKDVVRMNLLFKIAEDMDYKEKKNDFLRIMRGLSNGLPPIQHFIYHFIRRTIVEKSFGLIAYDFKKVDEYLLSEIQSLRMMRKHESNIAIMLSGNEAPFIDTLNMLLDNGADINARWKHDGVADLSNVTVFTVLLILNNNRIDGILIEYFNHSKRTYEELCNLAITASLLRHPCTEYILDIIHRKFVSSNSGHDFSQIFQLACKLMMHSLLDDLLDSGVNLGYCHLPDDSACGLYYLLDNYHRLIASGDSLGLELLPYIKRIIVSSNFDYSNYDYEYRFDYIKLMSMLANINDARINEILVADFNQDNRLSRLLYKYTTLKVFNGRNELLPRLFEIVSKKIHETNADDLSDCLLHACNCSEIFNLLFKAGAYIKNESIRHKLMYQAIVGDNGILEILLNAGVDVNSRITFSEKRSNKNDITIDKTPLELAIRKQNIDAVMLIISHPSFIATPLSTYKPAENNYHYTSYLTLAIKRNSYDVAEFLLKDHKELITTINSNGRLTLDSNPLIDAVRADADENDFLLLLEAMDKFIEITVHTGQLSEQMTAFIEVVCNEDKKDYIKWLCQYIHSKILNGNSSYTQNELISLLMFAKQSLKENCNIKSYVAKKLRGIEMSSTQNTNDKVFEFDSCNDNGKSSHAYLKEKGMDVKKEKNKEKEKEKELDDSVMRVSSSGLFGYSKEHQRVASWFDKQLTYDGVDTETLKAIRGIPNCYLWIPERWLTDNEDCPRDYLAMFMAEEAKFSKFHIRNIHIQKPAQEFKCNDMIYETNCTHEIKHPKAGRLFLYQLLAQQGEATLYIAIRFMPALHNNSSVKSLRSKTSAVDLSDSLLLETQRKNQCTNEQNDSEAKILGA